MMLLAICATLAAVAFAGPAPADAKPYIGCGSVSATIGSKTYVVATKVKAKGMTCTAAKAFWKAYATGTPGSTTVEDLRQHCKQGSKEQMKAAAAKHRYAKSCVTADGKKATKAWLLGG